MSKKKPIVNNNNKIKTLFFFTSKLARKKRVWKDRIFNFSPTEDPKPLRLVDIPLPKLSRLPHSVPQKFNLTLRNLFRGIFQHRAFIL